MKHILFLLVLLSLLSCKKEIEPDSDTFNSTTSNFDSVQPTVAIDTTGYGYPSDTLPGNKDWFLTRVLEHTISTADLFHIYGVDGFKELKTKDEYWKDKNVVAKFKELFGSEAKLRFDDKYDYYKKEFEDFKLGIYNSSSTGDHLLKDHTSTLQIN